MVSVHSDRPILLPVRRAASVPLLDHGKLCPASLRWLADLCQLTVTAAACGNYTLARCFRASHRRIWRTCLYGAFGLGLGVPIIHGVLKFGWQVQSTRISFPHLAGTAMLNIVGAIVYSARVCRSSSIVLMHFTHSAQIPERWAPGRFDSIGSSHQILHITVVAAAWMHYCGIVKAFHSARSGANC